MPRGQHTSTAPTFAIAIRSVTLPLHEQRSVAVLVASVLAMMLSPLMPNGALLPVRVDNLLAARGHRRHPHHQRLLQRHPSARSTAEAAGRGSRR